MKIISSSINFTCMKYAGLCNINKTDALQKEKVTFADSVMFTGIIEATGRILSIRNEGSNRHFTLACPFSHELKTDQSVAHDGVCLTVTHADTENYTVTAIDETLKRSNLSGWQEGSLINLERCMKADARFDGHIVQGHVDQTAICTSAEDLNGSWKYHFKYDPAGKNITVEKGSITVNGVSLTVVDSGTDFFSVAVIPYTWQHTNFRFIKAGSAVNLEFDIVGKYIQKLLGK
jgi:riboflavin synthase